MINFPFFLVNLNFLLMLVSMFLGLGQGFVLTFYVAMNVWVAVDYITTTLVKKKTGED